MLGLLTDPIVETTPDDSEAAVLGVPGEGGPTLLDNVELTPVGCREVFLIQDREREQKHS
jgi:hypothetical protein